MTLSGANTTKTDKVRLQGDYRVHAELASGSSGCGSGLYLVAVDQSLRDLMVNEVLDPSLRKWFDTNAYGLPDADYYVESLGDCEWTIAMTPK